MQSWHPSTSANSNTRSCWPSSTSTKDAYAVPVRELIEQRTGRPVARGALYTGLDRLEAKGCLKSRMGDPSEERGGKARRYYTVTRRRTEGDPRHARGAQPA